MEENTTSGSVTVQLAEWVANLQWDSVPERVRERVRYLILDGLACALVASHLPWSEQAVHAVLEMESPGACPIVGWPGVNIGPLPAALLNSTFIQGFELDDYHSVAPLHSNSIILPALMSLVEHTKGKRNHNISGKDFMLATLAGYEIGPRVGLALHGGEILSRGWHSGPVFGPAASAGASSKLLKLNAIQIEDALGIACTQACGLMSAQFESSVKRMQHGFAARNGLFAALMAESGYKGIRKVFERDYGGFLKVYTLGAAPPEVQEVVKGLSEVWQTLNINVKPYACMAGIHATVDCIKEMQASGSISLDDIQGVKIEMGEAAYKHGGWKAEEPINVIGAQMNASYIAAAQLIDGDIGMRTFSTEKLNRQTIWDLVRKIQVVHQEEFDRLPDPRDRLCTRVTTDCGNGNAKQSTVVRPTGVKAPLTNEDIVTKFETLTFGLISREQQAAVINLIAHLEDCEDVSKLFDLLVIPVANPLA
ncbi:hypothetical protein BZG36_01428 [Bifiguratus adelaidae]|uniref:MmgE/PrpD family protein n=1 Tax=Bifiguratus adelaidae TaxID=1938954 RepID=A0A261Y4Y6_9FUNG|nr:hypothetical protein BZG36_01428 [Bifiguratus adelaidae]